jgi:hypothetical protein
MGGDDDRHDRHYPYARYDECSWHPEEVARRLGELVHRRRGAGGASSSSFERENVAEMTTATRGNDKRLLTRGRSTSEVRALRRTYGGNALHGDHPDIDDDDDEEDDDDGARRNGVDRRPSSSSSWRRLRRSSSGSTSRPIVAYVYASFVVPLTPIFRAFYDQLKEPLIVMLLFSASISLCLGNTADALSIGMALVIVSLVAAVQEYRSERGEMRGALFFFATFFPSFPLSVCFALFLFRFRRRLGSCAIPWNDSRRRRRRRSPEWGGGEGEGGEGTLTRTPFPLPRHFSTPPPLNGRRRHCHFLLKRF